MTIIISGSTGVSGVDGSAGTPSLQGGDANTGFFYGSDILGFSTGGSERMRIDASGNLGLGVTPSAWGTSASTKALQVGNVSLFTQSSGGNYLQLSNNAYQDSSLTWKYIGSDYASNYQQFNGIHKWYTAPSGTAGNAISFTQAMTLDASGRLMVGTATPAGGASVNASFINSNGGGIQVGQATLGGGAIIGNTNSGLLFYGYTGSQGSETYYQRMVIDSSGNVGVGTSSPAAKLQVKGATNQNIGISGEVQLSGAAAISAVNDAFTSNVSLEFRYGGTNAWFDNGTERMRINSNGNLLIGCTTEAANETHIVLSTNSGTTRWSVGPWSSVSNNFYITATSAAQGVYLSGTTATSWSALSDERWKTELQPIENAAEKVSTLRAVTGVYTNDANKKRKPFLIAQDVLAVLPEAVDTENPEKYGLAYTEVIPLLVAAIQELNAKVESLEAQLKGAA